LQARELARDHETLLREVTERKRVEDRLRESEELFRVITESTADIISLWDPLGKLVYVSPAFVRTLGYDSPTTIEAAVAECFHPDDVRAAGIGVQRIRAGDFSALTFRMRHLDGTWR